MLSGSATRKRCLETVTIPVVNTIVYIRAVGPWSILYVLAHKRSATPPEAMFSRKREKMKTFVRTNLTVEE